MTCTVAFNTYYTNIIKGALSTSTTPGVFTGTVWGGSPSGTPAQDSISSGSIIINVTSSNYYNLVLTNSGGGTIGAAYGFYSVARIG